MFLERHSAFVKKYRELQAYLLAHDNRFPPQKSKDEAEKSLGIFAKNARGRRGKWPCRDSMLEALPGWRWRLRDAKAEMLHQAGIPLPEKKAPKTPREPVEGTASKKRKASGEKEKKGRSAYIMCAARPPARRLPASSISPSYRHTASARGRQSGRAPRVGSLPLLACPLLRERPPGWCAGFAPRRA